MRILIALFAILSISPRALAGLRTLTTNHYRIQTDIEIPLADDLAKRMDVTYDEYARRLVDFSQMLGGRSFDVFIFQHRSDYMNHTGVKVQNSGGVFIPSRGSLEVFLEGQGRDGIRRTLQHEAFHQFALYAIGPKLPVWLNEGLAQVFEEGIYDGQTFHIGQVPPRRVRQLKYDIEHRQLFTFRDFMGMTHDQWEANLADKSRGDTEYTQAWAMAHYLIFAEDGPGKPRFRSRLIDMLRLIRNNRDAKEAFIEAFSDNIEGFQKMFLDYAKTLEPTPTASYIERQDTLAELMITLKLRQNLVFYDIPSYRRELARWEFKPTDPKQEIERDPGVYFHDLEGRAYSAEQLYLVPRLGLLPDIISRPTPSLQLHTRFSELGDRIDHEILIESPSR
jgi:hypothetical protein